jgi:hypothetical protein
LEELILSTNNHVICWHIHVRNNHVCSVENYWIFQVLSSMKYVRACLIIRKCYEY